MKAATFVRSTAGVTLSAVAKVLSAGSRVTERVAGIVRPGQEERPRRGNGQETAAVADIARRGVVREPPTEPTVEGPSRVRTYETHVEAWADQPASEVVAAVPDLSTEELGRLYEHEAANKKRKSVLAAIERAAASHGQPSGHEEPMPEAGGVPTGGGPAR